MTNEQVILRNQYVIMRAMSRGPNVPSKTKDEFLVAMRETEAQLAKEPCQ